MTMGRNIPLFKIYWDEQDVEKVTEVIKKGMNWATGPNVQEFENAASINGTVTDPDGSVFLLDFTGTTTYLWSSVFAETARLGKYDLSIRIVDLQGNITEFGRDFYVVVNPESGVIKDMTLPEQVTFNDALPISVVFENIDDSDYEVMLEVEILDDGVMVGSVEGDMRIVGVGSTTAGDKAIWVVSINENQDDHGAGVS